MAAPLEQAVAKARQRLEDMQDTVAKALLKTVTELEQQEPITPKLGRKAGSAKGMIWMAPDFDAPLEDFKGYM